MTPQRGPDFSVRSPEGVAEQFEFFGEVECPELDAEIYRACCRGIRSDPDLLAIAAQAPVGQPPPNLLFASVHYLLLGGAEHPLRDWYPGLSEGPTRAAESVFEPFRDFCSKNRDAIEGLIQTRLTQTNVLQRCSALLPAFARAFREGEGAPLALIEIGPSAGLNLLWDRFRYSYDDGTRWGDPSSSVVVECALRGGLPHLPVLPEVIPVASRCGVDIHPIDVRDPDLVRWLRALIWPDHPGRQERLTAAIEIACEALPKVVAGDASVELPRLIEAAPADASLCVYGTHTLYQFPRDALIASFKAMQAASLHRPIRFVSMEGTGDRCSELQYTVYADGERETTLLARCNPHGRWLEWLAG